MKIVVAFDKFKGSLDATAACALASDALRSALPGARVVQQPLADGGEGTAGILMKALAGTWIEVPVMGPRAKMLVNAGYARFAHPDRCLVEMASASGLALLRHDKRDPLRTTTYGTGQLLQAAFAHGHPVWLAVGGSATVDGGVGAAQALGWKFLDEHDRPVGLGGEALNRIHRIVPPASRSYPDVEVLCDVRSPLLGPEGAAPLYAPQKGASPEAVLQLEAGLQRLADTVRKDLGVEIGTMPGGGASGGLGAGAVAFFGARIVPGAAAVIAATGLDRELADADWVITGEGSFDHQSLRGKVVAGVLDAARTTGARVAVIAGVSSLADADILPAGGAVLRTLRGPQMSAEYSMAHAAELLTAQVQELAVTELARAAR